MESKKGGGSCDPAPFPNPASFLWFFIQAFALFIPPRRSLVEGISAIGLRG
jgi:hypothetical protein